MDESGEDRMDVWSEHELVRLIDELVAAGHVTDELADDAKSTLRSEGFQAAMRVLRAAGAFE